MTTEDPLAAATGCIRAIIVTLALIAVVIVGAMIAGAMPMQ